MYLEEYAEHLRSIRVNYGDGVAGQIVSLAELYSCPMPWEMEGAARFLAAGGDLDEIIDSLIAADQAAKLSKMSEEN